MILYTERLILRSWQLSDLPLFADINADERVCEYLPTTLTRAESDALAQKIIAHFDEHGFGLWAVEEKGGAPFIGFVGLSIPGFEAHFTPCVEIGWRLAFAYWGKGYATEAAKKVMEYGFNELLLDEIVSFTTKSNQRSRAVMERLGMTYSKEDDFDFPTLDASHPLLPHVLYRKLL